MHIYRAIILWKTPRIVCLLLTLKFKRLLIIQFYVFFSVATFENAGTYNVMIFVRGISQGSILAPLLFNTFPSIFSCTKNKPTMPLPKTFTDLVFLKSCTCTGTRSWY